MPYKDRNVQLQYLKDRRKRLRVGRKTNITPFVEPVQYNGNGFSKLAQPIQIAPIKKVTPYTKQNSIEREPDRKEIAIMTPLFTFV